VRHVRFAILLPLLAAVSLAQPPKPSTLLGTVTAVKLESAELAIRLDDGTASTLALSSETLLQRVAPGEKDLKQAKPATLADVAPGDRLLASFTGGAQVPRRVIIMAAGEINKRNEADRQDWLKRGLSGVVSAKSATSITLKASSMAGEKTITVNLKPETTFRRYAPDSVRFADAKESRLAEVTPGDQLRARGEKSADGATIDASEIVFGTFTTRAGSITAINLETREITLKELGTNKPLLVKLSADSQLKAMPDFGAMGGPGMMGGPGGMGGPGMMGGPGGMRPGGMGGPPDIGQMLERLPATKLEELKPGNQVLLSSTRGTRKDECTAILFLANAGSLIEMAQARNAAKNARNNAGNGMAGGMGMGGGGMGMGMEGGLGGLDLSGLGNGAMR